MSEQYKDRKAILSKLGISELNAMQKEAEQTISWSTETILLSPTGTGKTLAFLLPLISGLDPVLKEVQLLILVPSRELAIQIEQVTRDMGTGFKVNAIYGGRAGFKDKLDLKQPPAILIGTPGRIADHIRRKTISTKKVKYLVLDEFDKSLEVGFESEMKEITQKLFNLKKKVLTSATQRVQIPSFIKLKKPVKLDFLTEETPQLKLRFVDSSGEKLDTLLELLGTIGKGSGIIFCNLKDTIQHLSDYLYNNGIDHACFYGGLEQQEREHALIKFRNGTYRLLVATDLAARGIDVPEMDFIIHYDLPFKREEFIHRNGRTARMHENGTAYLIRSEGKSLPNFAQSAEPMELQYGKPVENSSWETLYISGGRRDKISKGDIAGLFFKEGGLTKEELGMIELKQDSAFVAVLNSRVQSLIHKLNNSKLKTKKVRISVLE
ncbi:MAG: DEAD/DEAH box helicase [Bacteroidota bacterium]